MISLFDANFLLILFHPNPRIPIDSFTKKPIVDRAQERVEFLVQTLSDSKGKIIVPAPALTEFLLLASDRWNEYLTLIRKKAAFEIAGFDHMEAVELVQHWIKAGGSKLRRSGPDTWAKLKYDRQIAAIARTRRVEAIYSTDTDLHKLAHEIGITAYNLADLPPPAPKQLELKEQANDGKEAKGSVRPFPVMVEDKAVGQGETNIAEASAETPGTE